MMQNANKTASQIHSDTLARLIIKKKENKAMVSLRYSCCYFCLLTCAMMMYSLCLLTPSVIAGVYNG